MKGFFVLMPKWGAVGAAAVLLLTVSVEVWNPGHATSRAERLPRVADGRASVNYSSSGSRDGRIIAPGRGSLFTGLGDLPGGIFGSTASCVSADGSVVAGNSNSASGLEAFRWTPATGMVGLGFGEASGVSANGLVVVGYRHDKSGAYAVRTARSGRIVELEKLPGFRDCEAHAVSADGSVIVGESTTAAGDQAFCWSPSDGMIRLDRLPRGHGNAAYAVSADGAIVVGSSWSADGIEASRWTRTGEVISLGTLPGDASSEAYGVSTDGSVVVGWSGDREAFRWTEEEGMVGLGALSGSRRNSVAMDVSADGSVVVGQSVSGTGMRAFIWNAADGMRSVREVLVDNLVPSEHLAGWKLTSANAVSADGRVIVGTGINPQGDREAWMAIVPSVAATTPGIALADKRKN